MTRVLKTARLLLERVGPQHAAPIVPLIGDADVSRWLTSVPHPYTAENAREFVSRAPEDLGNTFAITKNGTFMGIVSIVDQLGYWLGKPFWGQGYMSEATQTLVDHHFANGGAALESGYVLGNAGSARILTKLGFKPTHIKEAYVPTLGRAAPIQKMSLTRAPQEAAP